jgi:hypothetical protein
MPRAQRGVKRVVERCRRALLQKCHGRRECRSMWTEVDRGTFSYGALQINYL